LPPAPAADIARRQTIPYCGAYRRRVWEAVGGYYEDRDVPMGNEDWDFWIGVIANGFHGVHVPVPLFEYRQAAGSMATRLRFELWRAQEFIYRRRRDFFEKHQLREVFLRSGYEQSVWENARAGDYRTALPLAVRARELGSEDAVVRRLAKLARVPTWAVVPCAAAALLPVRLRRLRTNGLGVRRRLRHWLRWDAAGVQTAV
jgi:hypothetical protein